MIKCEGGCGDYFTPPRGADIRICTDCRESKRIRAEREAVQ